MTIKVVIMESTFDNWLQYSVMRTEQGLKSRSCDGVDFFGVFFRDFVNHIWTCESRGVTLEMGRLLVCFPMGKTLIRSTRWLYPNFEWSKKRRCFCLAATPLFFHKKWFPQHKKL